MQNLGKIIVFAAAFSSVGAALGFTLGVRRTAETPGAHAADPAAAVAPDRATTRQIESGRLGVAAAALARVPNLVPAPVVESHTHDPADRHVKRAALPNAVEGALRTLTKDREPRQLRLERRDYKGTPYYKVEFELDGIDQEYSVDEQGRVRASEITVAPSELPPTIAKGIETALPGAVVIEAERESFDEKVHYEIEIRYDGRRHEVEVAEDGSILKQKTR